MGNAVCAMNVFLCGSNQTQNSLGNHCPVFDLGQKPREGKNCPIRNGEVSRRQTESSPLVSGWRAVRGADCMSLGLKWRRLVEIWTGYGSPLLCPPFSVLQCWDPGSWWLAHSFSSSCLFLPSLSINFFPWSSQFFTQEFLFHFVSRLLFF